MNVAFAIVIMVFVGLLLLYGINKWNEYIKLNCNSSYCQVRNFIVGYVQSVTASPEGNYTRSPEHSDNGKDNIENKEVAPYNPPLKKNNQVENGEQNYNPPLKNNQCENCEQNYNPPLKKKNNDGDKGDNKKGDKHAGTQGKGKDKVTYNGDKKNGDRQGESQQAGTSEQSLVGAAPNSSSNATVAVATNETQGNSFLDTIKNFLGGIFGNK